MLPFVPETVAETLWQIIDEAVVTRGVAHLAIPGGRTPGPILAQLAGMLDARQRAALHLWWLDERCVPVGDAARNDATLAAWQSGGALPGHVHQMPAEADDLVAAAAAYEADLLAALAGEPLDVALIGIGEDGHFASLFPNHPGLQELGAVFVCTDSPKPPPTRLSLTLPQIVATRHKLVIALGADKGARIAESKQGPNPSVPVSLLGTAGVTVFVDDAAAAAAIG